MNKLNFIKLNIDDIPNKPELGVGMKPNLTHELEEDPMC